MAKAIKEKLLKYKQNLINRLSIIATVLDPRLNLSFFEDTEFDVTEVENYSDSSSTSTKEVP